VVVRRGIAHLSDREIKAWLRNGTTGKLSDGGALYLKRLPSGRAAWRMNYKWNGRARVAALGVWPDVTLSEARQERARVKQILREGKDPTLDKRTKRIEREQSQGNTLRALAEDWLEIRRNDWSAIHYRQSRASLESNALLSLGKIPVADITPVMIAAAVRPLAARSQDRTRKVLQHLGGIFRLAQARGYVRDNPALPVREEFPRKRVRGKRPAFTTFAELGEVLRVWNASPMSPQVRLCHRLIAFTAVRLSNALTADWKEFDFDSDVPSWTVPRSKMKVRDRSHDHRVILSPTMVTELKTWRDMTGGKGLLFPSPTGRGSLSLESLSKQMRNVGYSNRHTIHGWRASFATLAPDNDFSRDVVELTLDHLHDTETVRAYDRGERLAERIRLMYWWDAQLSAAQQGSVPLVKSA
jgi:integrase